MPDMVVTPALTSTVSATTTWSPASLSAAAAHRCAAARADLDLRPYSESRGIGTGPAG